MIGVKSTYSLTFMRIKKANYNILFYILYGDRYGNIFLIRLVDCF